MRKPASMLALLLILINAAKSENIQLTMPKIVYIGDVLEIRYIFHSEDRIFSEEFDDETSFKIQRSENGDFFSSENDDFSFLSASLEKIGPEYTLSISLIPWRTGYLQIPPFTLTSLFDAQAQAPFIVRLVPIEVRSLVEKTKKHSFLPQAGPMLLPGTTFLLLILSLIALFVFSALIFTLLHLPRVARFIGNLSYLYSLKRNSRRAIKRLLLLQKNSAKIPSDKDFAQKAQLILREFLSKRFSQDFSPITTNKLYSFLENLCGGKLEENQENAAEHLIEIFGRLDYVRFAEKAAFLTESENGGKNERISLCESGAALIKEFDDDGDFEERA